MGRLFGGFKNAVYDITKLVDHRVLEPYQTLVSSPPDGPVHHVVCDIDKTYLETDFESLTRMARIAFEAASDKVTVAGAPEVLSFARWGLADEKGDQVEPYRLHFVSSSPPQLRSVLSEKLSLDGLDWSSDTFKNQAYNLRMRRMDLLRQHIGYKSLAILNLMKRAGDGACFWMIGDNAESDPFIYLGIKLVAERQLHIAQYGAYLRAGGLEKKTAEAVCQVVKDLPKIKVGGIYVRCLEGYEIVNAPPLTDGIRYFSSYFEAVLQLMADGLLSAHFLPELVRRFHNRYGLDVTGMMKQAADYGLLTAEAEGPPWFRNALHNMDIKSVGVPTPDHSTLAKTDPATIVQLAQTWCEEMHKSKMRRQGRDEIG